MGLELGHTAVMVVSEAMKACVLAMACKDHLCDTSDLSNGSVSMTPMLCDMSSYDASKDQSWPEDTGHQALRSTYGHGNVMFVACCAPVMC